jgi:hypothetical protein
VLGVREDMPTMPHWYIVRRTTPPSHFDYDKFVTIIRMFGDRRRYAQMPTPLTYLKRRRLSLLDDW